MMMSPISLAPSPLSPSRLAMQAIGFKPEGIPWHEATTCSCCGTLIKPGDLALKSSFGASFTDDHSLAARTGVVCADCQALMSAPAMKAFQMALITADGVYNLSKDEHRAWMLLDPPKPPYVAVISDSMNQHLVWRTPVTIDNNLQYVRLGQRVLKIRRELLMQAMEWARDAVIAAHEEKMEAASAPKADSTRKPKNPKADQVLPKHPFVRLDRKLGHMEHGAIRSNILASGRARPFIERLLQLNPGELWALSILSKAKPEIPKAELLHVKL